MRIAPGGGSYTTAVPESPGVHPQAALAPLFPNPFNPVVSIQMELEHAAQGRVLIYDVSGRLVRTLVKGIIGAGPTTIRWDGTNEQGESVASGIYYCRLEALGVRLTRKVALVR